MSMTGLSQSRGIDCCALFKVCASWERPTVPPVLGELGRRWLGALWESAVTWAGSSAGFTWPHVGSSVGASLPVGKPL